MYQLVSYALGTFIALFPITNPIGAVPIFYSLTANASKHQRMRQAKKVALNQVLGFFILAISIQLLADGILTLLQESGLS